jgi:hypothetical protein
VSSAPTCGASGARWGDVVSPKWESVVASSFRTVKTEAERRGANRRRD